MVLCFIVYDFVRQKQWESQEEDESWGLVMEEGWGSQGWCTGAVAGGGVCVCVCVFGGRGMGWGWWEKCHPTSSESLLLQIDCWQLGKRRETAIMHILQPYNVNRLEYKCSFSIHPIPSVCSVVSVDVRADCQLIPFCPRG